jgi:hypothetical protein
MNMNTNDENFGQRSLSDILIRDRAPLKEIHPNIVALRDQKIRSLFTVCVPLKKVSRNNTKVEEKVFGQKRNYANIIRTLPR